MEGEHLLQPRQNWLLPLLLSFPRNDFASREANLCPRIHSSTLARGGKAAAATARVETSVLPRHDESAAARLASTKDHTQMFQS